MAETVINSGEPQGKDFNFSTNYCKCNGNPIDYENQQGPSLPLVSGSCIFTAAGSNRTEWRGQKSGRGVLGTDIIDP